jgi:hypothetical protein
MASNAVTFVTFYTNDAYLEDARRLERCCRHFGLAFEMVKGEELGSWKRNCNQKPGLLDRTRRRLSGPIVWLDSDCIVHERPEALLAARSEDAVLWKGGVSEKPYVSSQVMWWNDSPSARAMIADWAKLAAANPGSLADPLLKTVCDEWRGAAVIGTLPPAYLKPYWKPEDGVRPEEIVISSNERRCVHPDATPRQVRLRLDPLRLPYA